MSTVTGKDIHVASTDVEATAAIRGEFNHGLLRKGEPEEVIEVFRNQMNANLVYVDATDRFLE